MEVTEMKMTEMGMMEMEADGDDGDRERDS